MLKKIQNESQQDRMIRLVLGVVLALAGYFFFSGTIQIVVYVLSVIALVTGLTGFCLLYKIFGIKTLK